MIASDTDAAGNSIEIVVPFSGSLTMANEA
jgi:hypothetical protein